MKKIFLFSLIAVLTGCSSAQYKDKDKYHQISADRHGDYHSLYKNSFNGQCGLNDHLKEIIKQLKGNNKTKVMISIHGGLNSINSNIERVEKHLKKHCKNAECDGYYPIFIGWRSGAGTTLKDRYFHIRSGINSPYKETIPSSPLYIASDLLRGIGSIPESFWDQGKNFYKSHKKRITGFDEEDINDRENDFGGIDFYYTGRGYEKSFWEQVGYATRQVLPGVARIISTPLIEGVANESWQVMLRRAKTLMYRQGDLSYRGVDRQYSEQNPVPNYCEKASLYFREGGPNGIVAQLMRALQKEFDKKLKITLVGHSMGAIIANDIVHEFNELNYDKIIHMASADSIRNLMIKTMPYLDEHKESTDFYNLMLHPTNEEQEQSALGTAPEGSLLVWLDDMLVNPETQLDRRSGRWDNIKWAFPFFEGKNNMHFKLFGLRKNADTCKPADTCEPIEHGKFDDFGFWREDFYWGKPKQRI